MDIEIKTGRHDLADMPADMRAELEVTSQSRRDFMKVTGMAAMGAVIAGCTAKDRLVKPLLEKPEGITPGVVYDYAGTCQACNAGCGMIMKVRDGRPVKLEGSREHPLNRGGLCARGQAQLWSLYDAQRLKGPANREGGTDWAKLDAAVSAACKGGAVWLLTGTVSGPAARAAIQKFCEATGARHVAYDAVSAHSIAAAHQATHNVALVPHYQFDRAEVIVSFDADFLGNWISGPEFSAQWVTGRDLQAGQRTMSRHVQFEARYSLTGANADQRYLLPDAQRGAVLVDIANRIAGSARFGAPGTHEIPADMLDKVAVELKAARGKALVVCGSRDVEQQKLVNWINNALGAYGTTIDLRNFTQQKLGNDDQVAELLKAMEAGTVKTLVIHGVNPVYDLPQGEAFKAALAKVGTTVAMGTYADETAAECAWMAADDDGLERWNDSEPLRGLYSLQQPGIRRLYDTRSGYQSLLKWAGDAAGNRDYREFLKNYYEANILGDTPWVKAVEDGFVDARDSVVSNMPVMNEDVAISGVGTVATGEFEVIVHESYNVGDGRHAGNGWLQENGDPLTRVTWGNYVALNPKMMSELGVADGDHVSVNASVDGRNATLTLPAVRQPGQADRTAVISLGYGRTRAGKIIHGMGEADANAIGGNAYPFVSRGPVFGTLSRGDGHDKMARIQEHDSQEGRPLLKEATFAEWLKRPSSGNDHEIPPEKFTLWKQWDYKGHKWEMVVDLNKCTGCNACVVACSIENNVPIVGKKEVLTRREMHWLRIDVYYEDDKPGDGKLTQHPNPTAGFQPMMCQHCGNAPCETVCPVLATVHSEEGLNTQAYNRCIGTRYCANNCPYKVRRFNWFTYKHNDLTMNLALNPDITIRTQGIMEKCSMCAQRIYEGKRQAALKGEPVKDGAIRTACQSSCPTEAIVIGDANDKESRVAKLANDPRNYAVLAEINTRPGVKYLTKVRNR